MFSLPTMNQENPPKPTIPPNRLARLRRASRRTMADLAALCGVDVPTYRAWEKGQRIPELQRAVLSDLYGVSIAHLLGTDTDPAGDGER